MNVDKTSAAVILATLIVVGSSSAALSGSGAGTKLCESSVRSIEAAMAATMAEGSPGMIVEIAQSDRTLFSRSLGYADLEHEALIERESVFPIASVTKMFTATSILSLVENGDLSLQDPIGKFFPELSPEAAKVRIYDLLIQTSGIPDFTDDEALATSKSVGRSTDEMVDLITRRSTMLNFTPGSQWEYSNSNYVLLGATAERLTGETLQTIFNKRLFERAGIAGIRFDDPADVVPKRVRGYREDPKEEIGFRNAAWISPTVPGAAGGLRGAAPDLVRWSEALFGGRVISERSVQVMSSPGLLADGRTTKFGMTEAWRLGLNSDYGMGVFIKETPGGKRIGHSGDIDGFSTWLAPYPASGVTIVQMINSESVRLDIDQVEAAVFDAAGRPCLRRKQTRN